jgi:uncharacterized membrane protein
MNAAMRVSRRYLEAYKGPLPPPKVLREFDEVVPGSAERIIALMERQADHRMHLEKCVVEGDNRRANWGIVTATSITILVLATSTVLIVFGYGLYGTILGAVDLVALASVFIYGTNSRKREREQKAAITKPEGE